MDWEKFLADPYSGPVISPAENESSSGALSAVSELGFFAARLDGSLLKTKADILDAFASAFEFPAYFGKNWDALADCLTDLSDWLPAEGYLLIVENAGEIEKSLPDDWKILLEILNSAGDWWKKQKIPFKVVLKS